MYMLAHVYRNVHVLANGSNFSSVYAYTVYIKVTVYIRTQFNTHSITGIVIKYNRAMTMKEIPLACSNFSLSACE